MARRRIPKCYDKRRIPRCFFGLFWPFLRVILNEASARRVKAWNCEMKIFRICPVASQVHLAAFRRMHELDTKPFAEQLDVLRKENVVLPGGWGACMKAEGFEVFETLFPDSALQGRWAEENQLRHLARDAGTSFRILLEQVKAFYPDVLFFYAGAFSRIGRRQRDELRAAARPGAMVVGFWGDELPTNTTYAEYFADTD